MTPPQKPGGCRSLPGAVKTAPYKRRHICRPRRLLRLIREHHIQPYNPYNDAYRRKRKIAEARQNHGVDFLTACAEQDAKEKQCNAF